MWGKNIGVVIVPSFLAITYIGQLNLSIPSIHLTSRFQFILSPLATWLASGGALAIDQGSSEPLSAPWGFTVILTGLAASMVVNALVTGLIVFKILKVFLEVKPTSVERTLRSSLRSTGGPKLRHIIFVIIESGMALFAIQLVRVVITSMIELQAVQTPLNLLLALDIVIVIHEMLNVIIKIRSFFLFY